MLNIIATKFLFIDQSDPTIDYNSEEFSGCTVEFYNEEAVKTLRGIVYLVNNINDELSENEIQTIVYDAAREYDPNDIRGFFKRIYQLLFSSNDGPRMPAFIVIYGVNNFIKLLGNRTQSF